MSLITSPEMRLIIRYKRRCPFRRVHERTSMSLGERYNSADGRHFAEAATLRFSTRPELGQTVYARSVLVCHDLNSFRDCGSRMLNTDINSESTNHVTWLSCRGPAHHLEGGQSCYSPSARPTDHAQFDKTFIRTSQALVKPRLCIWYSH